MSAAEVAEDRDVVPERDNDLFNWILEIVTASFLSVGRTGERDQRDTGRYAEEPDADQTRGQGSSGTIMLEQDVLKPIPDSAIADDNLWPIYQLQDVTIRETSSGELKSLFAANAAVSLVVSGYLAEVEEDFTDQVVDPDLIRTTGTFIEVQDVRFFSYGVYPDGEIGLWAAGKAGWYQIHPAAEYQAIYNHMTKSVELLHFLQDMHGQRKKPGGKIGPVHAQSVFEEYARAHPSECRTAKAAAKLLHEHRDFLIPMMLKKGGTIAWGSTGIYQHFLSLYRADFARIKAQQEQQGQQDVESAGPTTAISTAQGQSTKGAAVPESSSVETMLRFARGLLAILWDIYRYGRLPPGQTTLDAFARALHRDYDVPSLRHARKVLNESAPELVKLMAETKGASLDWTMLSIYGHLCDVARERKWSTRFLWEQLRLRQTPLPETFTLAQPDPKSGMVVVDDDEDEEMPVLRKRRRVRPPSSHTALDGDKHDKNILDRGFVPSSSVRSSSRRGKQDIIEARHAIDDDDDDDDEPVKPTRSSRRRVQPTDNSSETGFRSSQSRSKQPSSGLSSFQKSKVDLAGSTSKTHSSNHTLSSTISPTNQEVAGSEDENESWKPIWPRHLVIEEELPQHRGGSGSDDKKWICPLDGCLHTVWGPRCLSGQLRIHEHFQDHAREMFPPAREVETESGVADGGMNEDAEEDIRKGAFREGEGVMVRDEGEGGGGRRKRDRAEKGEHERGRNHDQKENEEEERLYLDFFTDSDEDDTRAWD